MSLRDNFEAWVIQHPHNKGLAKVQKYPSVLVSVSDAYADPSVELAWQAYQAGHAASGCDELLEALEGVCDSMFANGQYLLAKCRKLEALLDETEQKLQVAREAAGLATRMCESAVGELIEKERQIAGRSTSSDSSDSQPELSQPG